MKNENGKITIKSIWKFLRSDKGKKYSFVIFYAIFFIFLFIFISVPGKESNTRVPDSETNLPFKTKFQEENNYNFTYKEIINEQEVLFQGVKENNTITITNERDKYDYTYQDGELISTNELNPLEYYKLLDIYEIKSLLKDSELVTKVEFPRTNEVEFNYDISSLALGNLFNKDYETETNSLNRLIVNCNKDLEINKITLDIYNYLKDENKETDITSYVIEIDFLEVA